MNRFLLLLLCPMFIYGQIELRDVDKLFEQKNYREAEAVLTKFLKTHPNNLKAIEFLGDAYSYQKKWDDAIKQYRVLLKHKENHANYHYKYGGALGMKALSVSKLKAIGFIGDYEVSFFKSRRAR